VKAFLVTSLSSWTNKLFVDLGMKFDLNSLIGYLFLFVLTSLVMRSFNEYNEYRFEVLHLLLFVLGIALAKGRIIEKIQLLTDVFNRGDKINFNDEEE
tara:strand:- start:1733 stop:2026 length:294 start_codon:yes stop_codon:yes gene_type:complete